MTIYVKLDGNDSNDGTSWDKAVKHIYKAIDLASTTDTIIIREGIYYENQGRVIGNKNLTLMSENSNYEDVIIVVNGVASGYYEVAYLILQGTSLYTLCVKDMTFKWGSATYTYRKGYILGDQNAPNIEVIRCFFDGNNIPSGNEGVAVGGRAGTNLRAYKCTFRNFRDGSNTRSAIETWDVNWNLYIKDNIFDNCYYAIRNATGTLQDEAYNCFYNCDTNIYNGSLDSTDLTTNPLFTSSGTATLQSNSPCIDAGVVIPSYITNYIGTNPDIGCYEYPEYYYFAGSVSMNDTAVSGANIFLYKQDNGNLVASTTSSGDGGFYIQTTFSGAHFIVCVDPSDNDNYNSLIFSDLYPVTVSG